MASGLMQIVIASSVGGAANLLIRGSIDQSKAFRSGSALNTIADFLALLPDPKFALGVTLYFISMVLWFQIIAAESLSVAYPMMISLTFAIVTIGAMYFFGERITLRHILGLVLIIGGIATIAAGSRTV